MVVDSPDTPLVDRMVDELREAGEAGEVEAGGFSLDPARAERRLRELKLPNPLHWVLLALRGAVRGGATRVSADAPGRDLEMRWDAALALPEDPGRLFDAAVRQEVPGLRELLLACFVGVGAGMHEVVIESGERRVRIHAEGTEVASGPAVEGTRLRTRGRIMRDLDRQRAELWVLRKRGRYLEIELLVGGEPAAFGFDQVDLDAGPVMQRERGPVRAAAMTVVERGEVRFLVDGVWVDEKPEWSLVAGLVVVVGGGLRLDAGEARIVKDAAFRAAMEAARAVKGRTRGEAGDRAELEAEVKARAGASPTLWPVFAAAFVICAPIVFVALSIDEGMMMVLRLIVATILGGMVSAAWTWSMFLLWSSVQGLRNRRWVQQRLPPHHPARSVGKELRRFLPQLAGGLAIAGTAAGFFLLSLFLGVEADGRVVKGIGPALMATATVGGWATAIVGTVLWLALGMLFERIEGEPPNPQL